MQAQIPPLAPRTPNLGQWGGAFFSIGLALGAWPLGLSSHNPHLLLVWPTMGICVHSNCSE